MADTWYNWWLPDWLSQKGASQEARRSGAAEIPEAERDPLTQNAYWTPADEAEYQNPSPLGAAVDAVGSLATSPVSGAKKAGQAFYEGLSDIIPYTRESLTRVPETDQEIKDSALRGFSAVGTAALLNAPVTATGAMAGLAANNAKAGALSFLDDAGGFRRGTKKALGYDPEEVAKRYPVTAKPVKAIDKKTGKPYLAKQNSKEAKAVARIRKAAQKDIEAGNYKPLFPVEQRYNVDPSNYPLQGTTLTDSVAKKEVTRDKWRSLADTPETRANLRGAFERAKNDPNAHDWYGMGQLEKAYVDELGPEIGRARFAEDFADGMAATTGGSDPTANYLMTHYGNFLKQNQLPTPKHAYEMPYPIGGRFAAGNMGHYDKMIRKGQGIDAANNPKRFNFSGNFKGHSELATIDEQMSGLYKKGLKQPPKGSYGIYQQVLNDVADEVGVPPMNFQDVAWAGAKGVEGKPMIQHVNEAIERTSRVTGKSPEDVLKGIIHRTMPLYAQKAEAGAPGVLVGQQATQAREWVPSRASGHLEGVQDMPYIAKESMTQRSPFMKPDPAQSGPSLRGVGAYEGSGGLETNPMRATPYNATPEDVNAIGAYYGGMMAQDAVPSSWPKAGIEGPNTFPANYADIATSDPLSIPQMQSLGGKPPGGAFAVIDDSKRGTVRYLGGDDLSSSDIVSRMADEGAPGRVSAEGVGSSNYPDFSDAWKAEPGSGQVTRQMLDAMDQATPGTRGAFDSFEMRQRARAANMQDFAIAERYGLKTRDDLMRMREIYGKEGFEGLRAALARGDALPSNADVAGIVSLITQAGGSEEF